MGSSFSCDIWTGEAAGHSWPVRLPSPGPGCPPGQCYSRLACRPTASPGSLWEMQNLGPSPRCAESEAALIGLPGASCTVRFQCGGLVPSSFRRGRSGGLSAGTEQVLHNKRIHPPPLPPPACTPPVCLALLLTSLPLRRAQR